MQKIRWFFLIFAIVITLTAMLQNNHETKISLLWMERTMPLSMLLMASVTIGFLIGSLTTASMLRSHRKKKEAAKQADKQASKQVDKLADDQRPAESPLPTAAAD